VKSQQELFRRLEKEVRTRRQSLPIDGFLPDPETLPTEFPDPPASALPVEVRELGTLSEAEDRRRERRKMRRARRPPEEAAQSGKTLRLEDEIQEFMNRDRPPGSRPEELSEFIVDADPPDPAGEK
jgi:hypothetical protein